MVAADEAIHHSGILQQTYNPDRIGVVWGAGIGGLSTFFDEIVDYARGDGTPRFSPFFIPKMIVDIAPGFISIKHGFRGPNYCTVSACASSTHALIDAFNLIRLGKADAIVSGGSEASVNEPSVGGFTNMKALSERNDDFMTASRPFDNNRDGFVMGEGAAAIILEDYEHAKARGAKIYAEIVGGGMTADAYHLTAPHPEGLGACNVMKVALEDAGMLPSDIDYINVHGTSTPLGDIAESKAILSVFGENAYNLNISSTKSMTGHLLGGAGAIEALACILAVSEDIIPPTINHFTDDPEFDPNLNFTFNVAQKRTVRAALSNTFGFGGHNGSVIFKKIED
jgi:3-oxoacyl-[acyl-carrier-protein] synthase II